MSQQAGSEPPRPEPSWPPAEAVHPADALDALARGQEMTGEQVGQSKPDSPDFLNPALVTTPGDAGEIQLVPLQTDPPAEADMLQMAEAASQPVARRRVRHHSFATSAPTVWRVALPVLAAMALLMFVMTTWSILVLCGVNFLVEDASGPRTRQRAWFLLMSLPVGLFLAFGCYVIWRDLRQVGLKKRKAQARPGASPADLPVDF